MVSSRPGAEVAATHTCPGCSARYNAGGKVVEHVRQKHKGASDGWSKEELGDHDLTRCSCGKICHRTGLKKHQTSAKCQVPGAAVDPARETPPADPEQDSEQELASEDASLSLEDRYKRLLSLPTLLTPLPPHALDCFLRAADRVASAYVQDPTEQTLLDVLALPKEALVPNIAIARKRSLERDLRLYPRGFGEISLKAPKQRAARAWTTQVQRAIAAGRISHAAKILTGTSKLLEVTPQVLEQLRELHPQGPVNPFGNNRGLISAGEVSYTAVLKEIKKLPKDVAPGGAGWSVELLLTAFRKDSSFAEFLCTLIKQIHNGSAPAPQILCASTITPLDKAPGVRPIAVGEIFYRLAGKCLIASSFKRDMLLPNQLSVKSPGGVEPIVHLWHMARTDTLGEHSYDTGVAIDCKNAFNTIDRKVIAKSVKDYAPAFFRMAKWAYNEETPLYVRIKEGIHTLQSSQGVRQGDPLGPLLFSLGFRPTIQDLITRLGPQCNVWAYLDDVFPLLRGKTADDAISIMQDNAASGVHVNVPKTKSYELKNAFQDVRMLGTYSGPDPAGFLREKIDTQLEIIRRLDQVHAQTSLILLRRSVQLNLHHLLRTTQLLNDEDGLQKLSLEQQWERLDAAARAAILRLRGRCTTENIWDRTLIHLPVRFGGLGLMAHRATAPHALAASIETAKQELKGFYPHLWSEDDEATSQKFRMLAHHAEQATAFDKILPPTARLQWQDQHSFLSAQWLHAIPYNKFTTLSPTEIATGLHYRTLTRGFNAVCKYCSDLNVLGHDELCQKRNKIIVERHEYIKEQLARTLKEVPDTMVWVEPSVYGEHGEAGKTDIRIAGTASFEKYESHYDVTLVVLHAKTCQKNGKVRIEDVKDRAQAKEAIKSMLGAREKYKRDKYASMVKSVLHPLVFSLGGGTVSRDTQQIFDFWADKLSYSQWTYMMRGIGIGLLRAKATFFAL